MHLNIRKFGIGILCLLGIMSSCKQKGTGKTVGFDVSTMDTTVSPCDDFDQFANGGWKKNTKIPSTEASWGAFEILNKENESKQKGIIQEVLKGSHKKGSNGQLISDFYKSYMDTVTIEKLGTSSIQPYFDKIDKATNFDDLLYINGTLPNMDNFFNYYVEADLKDTKVNQFYIVQSGLVMGDREYYLSNAPDMVSIRTKYMNFLKNMHVLIGQTPEQSTVSANTIFALEKKIAEIHLAKEEMRDPVKTYNKKSYAELKALAPNINFDKFFEGLGKKPTEVSIDNVEIITKTNALIKTVPLADWKAYLKWQLLTNMAPYLNKSLEKERFAFFGTVMNGIAEQKPRDERGLRNVNRSLGEPFGKLFVEKYFSETSKMKIGEMIENLRSVYKERVQQLDWMTDSTKMAAVKKLDAFTYKIGYPNKWKDYSKLEISADKLFDNVIAINRYETKLMLDKLGKPVDKDDWLMTPQLVNAYYNPTNNEVVFPAGILQPPFYNPDADDAINYGGIMAVIGHEFTHGFDDQGSQFAPDGTLNDWWTAEDKAKFAEKTNKLVAHYNKFEVLPGLFCNGEFTQGENIADQGGVILAYYALLKSLEGKPEPKPIDGYTYKQRFFLGWAQVWRDLSTDESLKSLVATNPHAPAKARINATLSNLKEFHDAWGCTSGKMCTPEAERALVW